MSKPESSSLQLTRVAMYAMALYSHDYNDFGVIHNTRPARHNTGCYLRGMVEEEFQIPDIRDGEQLIRYAVAAQCARAVALDRVGSQNAIAKSITMERGNFSKALNRGQNFTDVQLKQLDELFSALGLPRAGGLSALAVRLRGAGNDGWTSLHAHIPPGWGEELLARPADQEVAVLIQAAALVARQRAASLAERPAIGEPATLQRVVRQLVMMGAAPPTRRNVEALILLGTLAGYSFDAMQDELESALRSEWMPYGFRVWRAVTKSVLLNIGRTGGRAGHADTEALRAFVERILEDAETLRDQSLYPGRSLDLELAIAVPAHWSPSDIDRDWVYQTLHRRATNPKATLRERGTAAHGLWQRALADPNHDRARVKADLLSLIKEFRENPDRPDVESGMRWVAATLEQVLQTGESVCNQWPTTDEPWMNAINKAAQSVAQRGLPNRLRAATRTLFEHAMLQNAGVHRRQAVDTLVAAGLAEQVSPAFVNVLNLIRDEPWLRIRALFALGFLQDTRDQVARALAGACVQAHAKLKQAEPAAIPPALITELHAALFALGDCFGPRTADPAGTRLAFDSVKHVLEDLVDTGSGKTGPAALWPVARAVGYLLSVIPREGSAGTVADASRALLTQLTRHPDDVTSRLATWALTVRFADDGKRVRPLLDAATATHDGL